MDIIDRIALDLKLDKSYLARIASCSAFYYRDFKIKKRNGDERCLAQPSPELKTLQYWVLNNVLNKIPVSEAACAYKNGTVLVHVKKEGLCQVEPGTVPMKILASCQTNKGLHGSPVWDGKETLAINFRHGRVVRKVHIPSVEDAKLIWQEILEGYPDRAVFWDGKMVVPGGYQGILIEK